MNQLRHVPKELLWAADFILLTLLVTCTVPFLVDPRWWYSSEEARLLYTFVNGARWVAIISLWIVPRMIEKQIKTGIKAEVQRRESDAAPSV